MIVAHYHLTPSVRNKVRTFMDLGPQPTHYPEELLLAFSRDKIFFIYGVMSNCVDIFTFEPLECGIWETSWNFISLNDGKGPLSDDYWRLIVRGYSATPMMNPDARKALLCLVQSFIECSQEGKLDSKQVNQGLIALGYEPIKMEWFRNHLGHGLVFRVKTETDSKYYQVEDYVREFIDVVSGDQERTP